jgi:hypothetical protein
MHKHIDEVALEMTAEKTAPKKRYIFASDFDQTLSFNDSGYVLSELLGISVSEFERKTDGMTKLNLVQQGGELVYLLLHDPEFRSRVRREHLYETGKRVRLKPNIDALYSFLSQEVEGFHFDFYVISAAPVEVICSALEGIVPPDHIYGTEFEYNGAGEIERISCWRSCVPAPTASCMSVTAAPISMSCCTSTAVMVSPSLSRKTSTWRRSLSAP